MFSLVQPAGPTFPVGLLATRSRSLRNGISNERTINDSPDNILAFDRNDRSLAISRTRHLRKRIALENTKDVRCS